MRFYLKIFSVVAALVFAGFTMYGQSFPAEIKASGKATGSSEDLFIAAKAWLLQHGYVDDQSNYMEDKAYGKIVIRRHEKVPGIKNFLGSVIGYDDITYVISVDVKQDHYRIVLNAYNHSASYRNGLRIVKYGIGPKAPSFGSLSNNKVHKRDTKRWNHMRNTKKAEADALIKGLTTALVSASDNKF